MLSFESGELYFWLFTSVYFSIILDLQNLLWNMVLLSLSLSSYSKASSEPSGEGSWCIGISYLGSVVEVSLE